MTVSARFPFVQFEFSHNIGPPEGRYIVRPFDPELSPITQDEPEIVQPGHAVAAARAEDERQAALLGHADVLLVKTRGGIAAKAKRMRRSRDEDPGDEVALAVVTVIKATRQLTDASAQQELMRSLSDEDEAEKRVDDALYIANRAVSAYRVCSADPYVATLTRFDARRVLAGWGTGEKLNVGDHDEAVRVPLPRGPRVSRADRLMPTQGMAAVLAGREPAFEGEELLLRVLIDLEQGRLRAAALGLRAATELLIAELGEEAMPRDLLERYRELLKAHQGVTQLAELATREQLSLKEGEKLAEVAEATGALVDSWRYRADRTDR